jgi:2-oxoisovalerate dehydrogenase E1 component
MAIAREAEPVGSLREVKEAGLDREDLLGIYRNMLVTRGVEERGHILYRQGKIPGSFYTGRGNEGSAVGIATAMGPDDVGTPLHRDMGVHITRGVEPWRIFAQYMGRADGPTKGRDGNVHMADSNLGLIAMVSHLPAMLPVAVGCALAFRIREEKRVAVGWFGEGASARGDAHEAMNLAGVRQLPVVFICDNNQWAYSTPTHLEYACEHLADRAQAYGFEGVVVDGTDVLAVYREASDREGARRRRTDDDRVDDAPDGGPRRPRRRLLRPEGAVRALGRERSDRALPDVAPRERRAFRRRGGRDLVERQEAAERRAHARRGVADAGDVEADRGRLRDPRGSGHAAPQVAVAEKTYLQAISDGLREEMRRDKRVFVIGEDVGVYGGAFKVTLGFQEEFGSWRVIDAPLSETAIVGGCTGAAMMGMRPVAEMQFADFISCAWDHLVTVAAKQRWRAGTPVPITVRLPSGGGFSGGPFHSQNPESSFAHIPGLKVICPATPEDAKGLLATAIQDPNPCLYFEHKHLYRRIKADVPDERYETPFGKARVHKEGSDLSVITWGAMVYTAEEAAQQLDSDGVSVEILDLRTLLPWDKQAVLESARKTSKVLVLHEDTHTGGFGAEIAATISEDAFEDLDAPVKRVTAPDTPVPFSPPLEKAFIPQVEDVVAGLRDLAEY